MMIHKGTVQMETERLILRKAKVNDAVQCFHNWYSDTELFKYTTWSAHTSVKDTINLFQEWEQEYRNIDFYVWVIVIKDNHKPVGMIIANECDDIETMEVGYILSKKWQKQGIMTEAMNRVVQFLFEEMHTPRIQAICDEENKASANVMERIGMKHEGTLRNAYMDNRGIVNAKVYGILKTDYKKN